MCPWRQAERQTSAKQEPSVKYLLMQKQLYMWRAFPRLHGPCSQHTVQKPQTWLTSSASRLFFFLFFLNQFTACGGILNLVHTHTHTKKNTFKTQEAVQFDFAVELMTEILSNKWASEPLHFWFYTHKSWSLIKFSSVIEDKWGLHL